MEEQRIKVLLTAFSACVSLFIGVGIVLVTYSLSLTGTEQPPISPSTQIYSKWLITVLVLLMAISFYAGLAFIIRADEKAKSLRNS